MAAYDLLRERSWGSRVGKARSCKDVGLAGVCSQPPLRGSPGMLVSSQARVSTCTPVLIIACEYSILGGHASIG